MRYDREKRKGITENGVWERYATISEEEQMSKRLFVLMVCAWTTFGLGVSAWTSYICRSAQYEWPAVLGLIVLTFVGVLVASASRNPVVSLLGYMMIAVPLGALLGPMLALYTTASILKVLCITGGITVSLGLVGTLIPRSLEGWGAPFMGGLLVLIFGSFFTSFVGFLGLPVEGALRFWDWVGVVLFAGLIVFDFNRAMRVERSMTNAIDCAVGIYLDFLNMFLRLLSIMGKKN